MSGDRGVSFPVAALGMAALVLSTALLSHHAFDLLRLGEHDAVKQRPLTQPPVEARLWEDPLAATGRHRGKLREACSTEATKGAASRDPRCPLDGAYSATLPEHIAKKPENLVVIAALVPGASFMGVEEARRRLRFAVLAGLASKGFVPDDSERMGLLSVPFCEQFTGCEAPVAQRLRRMMLADFRPVLPARIDVPYETLSMMREGTLHRVAVLWIDDSKIGPRWLSTLTVLLTTAVPRAPSRLSILGPYTSDNLVEALDDVASLRSRNKKIEAAPPDPTVTRLFCRHWATLNRLELVSPYSTAPPTRLITAATTAENAKPDPIDCSGGIAGSTVPSTELTSQDGIDAAFKGHLAKVGVKVPNARPGPPPKPFFIRAIGTDDVQIRLLTRELCARGLGDGKGGRIVLLREWDSIYARSFAQTLGPGLNCLDPSGPLPEGHARYEIHTYLRGLDGATLDGASKQQRLVLRAAGDKARDGNKEPEIEWPENRDQRDYVRRLVNKLQDEAETNPKNRVRAVGIIGVDVHDKLLLAQALRPAFPERPIFTTDLDARLLHPEVARYTRNLIVSSSLPLSPSDLNPAVAFDARVAPFRDVYQTATFLGTRYASTLHPSEDTRREIADQLGKEHLYEIGRRSEIRLGVDKLPPDDIVDRRFYAGLSLVVLLSFALLMTYGKPGPAMKAALTANIPSSFSNMMISGLAVAAWGFALGVVAELAFPGHVGPRRAIALALTLMILFWVAIYRGPRPGTSSIVAGEAGRWCARHRIGLLVVLSAAGAFCFSLVQADHAGMREPFTLLSGVSGWPSQLLRALAVLLFGWFIDYTWNGSRQATYDIGERYFEVKPELEQGPVASATTVTRRMGTALREMSLWFWRPDGEQRDGAPDKAPASDGGMEGARLWRSYLRLLGNGPRFCRTVFWLVLVGIFVAIEMEVFGGDLPEIPARGLDDRALFLITIAVSIIGTIALMVMVSDSTILTWRFIQALKNLRTIYPAATVKRFAAELGPAIATDKATKVPLSVAARVYERGPNGPEPRNSLLDDWIDARLLADHTAAIAPLIFFPLTLLSLLIVARSPMFDNWAIDGPVLVVLVTYVLWTIAMATMLNFAAETARRKALENMRKDLLWLQGADAKYKLLAEHFPSLIKQVEDLRKGAFAPFFEQPLVRAVLVPLGGVGGIQLLDMLAFARS